MSNGFYILAKVVTCDGLIMAREVWGNYAEDPSKSFELTLSFTEQVGHTHESPPPREASVLLTRAEFCDLMQQLAEYKAAVEADAEAHGEAIHEFAQARDGLIGSRSRGGVDAPGQATW